MPTSTRLSLVAAVAMLACYYGAQLAAAPFFPNYSFIAHSASALGSDLSSRPEVLNYGAALTGVLALTAAWGLFDGLRSTGVWWLLALLFGLCSVSFGAASLWAAVHPMPDPRHDPGILGAGMFAVPFMAFIVSLQLPRSPPLRVYLALNIAGFAIVAMIFSQVLPVRLDLYSGLVQRAGTLVMLAPIAVVALWLLRRSLHKNRTTRTAT